MFETNCSLKKLSASPKHGNPPPHPDKKIMVHPYYPVFLIAEFDCKYFCHATEVLTHLVLQLVIS